MVSLFAMTGTPHLRLLVLLAGILATASCDMRALRLFDRKPAPAVVDAAVDVPGDTAPDQAPDLPDDLAPDLAPDAAPELPATPGCEPREEICNGADDDCDGQVDEHLAAIPCPNGGSRLCVAGRLSACPRRCEVCVPGTFRVCQLPYCTFWGVQECVADGRSFGQCREERKVPAACEAIAREKKKSAELERCCIDSGNCCLDEFDLDGDGDRTEMLGRCDHVRCD